MLRHELAVMKDELEGKTKDELAKLKVRHEKIEAEINSRPGAMALPQNKIRRYTEFSLDYIQAINEKLSLKV